MRNALVVLAVVLLAFGITGTNGKTTTTYLVELSVARGLVSSARSSAAGRVDGSLWSSCDELRGGMDASQYVELRRAGSHAAATGFHAASSGAARRSAGERPPPGPGG